MKATFVDLAAEKEKGYKGPKTKLITEWCDPEEVMSTQYGVIPARRWCELEVGRVKSKGDHVNLVTNGSQVAVARISAG